jgi:hypothetical protein
MAWSEMKSLFLVLLLAASATFGAPKKAPIVNPLPATGQFEALAWGTSSQEVKAGLTKAGHKFTVQSATKDGDVMERVVNEESRAIYGMASDGVMYTFRNTKLVGVTVEIKEAKDMVALNNLEASLKAIFGQGALIAHDPETHGFVVVFKSQTGVVILFAAAPGDTVMSQLLFLSQAEFEKISTPAPTEKKEEPKPAHKPMDSIKI